MLILDPDTPPTRTIYYTAGLALSVLRDLPEADLATVCGHLRERDERISRATILLALDFLFLLGLVSLTERGTLRCS